jgi:hypothetical protein
VHKFSFLFFWVGRLGVGTSFFLKDCIVGRPHPFGLLEG